jgi:histidinol-phosphatase
MSELQHLLDFAIETAFQAGQLTLGYFQSGLRPDFKADDTPVTRADREAETLIRSRIETHYPQHGILGEEFGELNAGASYRWIIDPIDGTKSFVRGVPLYGVLLGLERDGEIIVGVSYFPGLKDMVYAALGQGCYWNGRRTYVSDVRQLSEAIISCTDIASFQKYNREAAWQRLQAASYYRVGWSDAYGHMLVATGRCEVMLDPVMNSWDCAPFGVILKEAGGYFGSWSGEATIYAEEALSVSRHLKDAVLRLIREA